MQTQLRRGTERGPPPPPANQTGLEHAAWRIRRRNLPTLPANFDTTSGRIGSMSLAMLQERVEQLTYGLVAFSGNAWGGSGAGRDRPATKGL
jgi:hypothetical protein